MLAGCSNSTLLSPRHRLRAEAESLSPSNFQARHFQLPPTKTNRLDLPSTFSRQDSSRAPPLKPVSVSISAEKPIDPSPTARAARSLKQHTRVPPIAITSGDSDSSVFVGVRRDVEAGDFWEKGKKGLKRWSAEQSSVDESLVSRAKRKKKSGNGSERSASSDDSGEVDENFSFGQLGREHFWFQPSFHSSPIPFAVNCSRDEERVCFVPSELVSSPLLSSKAWVRSVVAEITDYREKEKDGGDGTSHGTTKEASGTRISSESQSLALRATRLWPRIFHLNVPREFDRNDEDLGMALRLFNKVSLIPRFVHFTANEILLRAFEGKDRVRVIDFDIKQGLQWSSLFQSLVSRSDPPSHIRITGIGKSKQDLIETSDRLAGFTGQLNLTFAFHPVVDRLEDVRLWMLRLKEGECVAANCILQLHKTLYDGTGGTLRDFLGLIWSTNPAILVVAEQEAAHNDPSLEMRTINSLRYYFVLFDLVDSSLPSESIVRSKIEEMFGREIRNIVACEGSDRLERHKDFSTWKKLMEQGEFRCAGITKRETLQGRMLLKMYGDEDFSFTEQEGQDRAALTINWQDQPLYTVSTWTPTSDVGGSPSSFSQQN